jgi:hypothetical protein
MKNNQVDHDFRRAADAESIQRQNAQILALQRYEKLIINTRRLANSPGCPGGTFKE